MFFGDSSLHSEWRIFIVWVWRAIRESPLRGLMVVIGQHSSPCFNYLKYNVYLISEHFLLVCKRKRSQKKSTRAVPARHPTAAAQTRTRRLFSPCSAHAPANSLLLRQCGLVRSALPPVPSPLSGSSAVCAAACGGWFFQYSRSNVCKWCHFEEWSDEESLMISPGFKRFFAALRMTFFYIVLVRRENSVCPYVLFSIS